jgi:hypothetical protein
MSNAHVLKAAFAVICGAAVLAGCGVKSSPEHPGGLAYPEVYPAGAGAPPQAPRIPGQRPPTYRAPGGGYQPPPAATDLNAPLGGPRY